MKTILVPTSGTETDTSVFATALALARSAHAHLEFYHLRLDPCEAALRDPRAQFCIGPAISATLSSLERRDSALSSNDPGELLLFHARHSDLTVLGRRHTLDLMPENLLEDLLKKSGRPIVIAPDCPVRRSIRTIVIGWKESDECARALTACMPLLTRASRVILLTVMEGPHAPYYGLTHLARQLKWNGISAEPQILADSTQPIAKQLTDTAREVDADLLVIGGFGHNSFREQVFGGVTRDLMGAADLPVFLMH